MTEFLGLSRAGWAFVAVLGGMAIGALCVGLLRWRWAPPGRTPWLAAGTYAGGMLVGGILVLLLAILAPALRGGDDVWALLPVLIGMLIGALVVAALPLPTTGAAWQLVAYGGGAMLLGGLFLGICALSLSGGGTGTPTATLTPEVAAVTFTPLPTITPSPQPPSPTTEPATATFTPIPTITPSPEPPTLTPTPVTPAPTPTPVTPTPTPPTPTPIQPPTHTATATPTSTPTATPIPSHVITQGGTCVVTATFSEGEGECNCPEGFVDTLEITVSEDMTTIKFDQPSTGDRNVGDLNPADGSFEANSEDGRERYWGSLLDICRGEGWNEYEDTDGCLCRWRVAWEPKPND